jgi:hypothetical protein
LGDCVQKAKGSSWQGRVVGFYSTELTPIGYAIESEREPGPVQIYPEATLTIAIEGSGNGQQSARHPATNDFMAASSNSRHDRRIFQGSRMMSREVV